MTHVRILHQSSIKKKKYKKNQSKKIFTIALVYTVVIANTFQTKLR